MKLSGLITLLLFHLLGEAIVQLTGLFIPGAVVGLLLLFFALLLRGRVSASLEQSSKTLIGFLPLLLILTSAGIFFLGENVDDQWLAFAGAIVAGTILTLIFCALLMKLMVGRHD